MKRKGPVEESCKGMNVFVGLDKLINWVVVRRD